MRAADSATSEGVSAGVSEAVSSGVRAGKNEVVKATLPGLVFSWVTTIDRYE